MSKRRALVWTVVTTVALSAIVACGQSSDESTPSAVSKDGPGGIAGIVTDLDGAPLAGMRVGIVSGTATFPEIAPETDEGGSYRISSVPPGKFEVGVHNRDGQRIGFESVVVKSGETASRDFSVSVGTATEEQPAAAASTDIHPNYIANKPVADFVEVRAASATLAELHDAQAGAGSAIVDLDIPSSTDVERNRVEISVTDPDPLRDAQREQT